MVFGLKKAIISNNIGFILDLSGFVTASFENLSIHVRNCLPSVKKMSKCRISPNSDGMGDFPITGLEVFF